MHVEALRGGFEFRMVGAGFSSCARQQAAASSRMPMILSNMSI